VALGLGQNSVGIAVVVDQKTVAEAEADLEIVVVAVPGIVVEGESAVAVVEGESVGAVAEGETVETVEEGTVGKTDQNQFESFGVAAVVVVVVVVEEIFAVVSEENPGSSAIMTGPVLVAQKERMEMVLGLLVAVLLELVFLGRLLALVFLTVG